MADLSSALQDCLEQLESGALSFEECLAVYPDLAAELRPLLESAIQLRSLPPVTLPAGTIDRLEAHIFERAILPPAKAASVGWSIALVTTLAGMMILGGMWLLTRSGDGDNYAALQERIEQQEATIAALQTQLSSDSTEPPDSMNSAPQTSASEDDQDVLPVSVSITGAVQGIDEEAGVLIVDGVVVQMDFTLLPEDFSPQTSPALTVTGNLLDDGIITATEIETPAPDTPTTLSADTADCTAERCHPVLLILSAAYETRYDELEALHQGGFGVGEVARMLAIAEGANVSLESVQSQREAGASWGQIMQSYPDVRPADFAPGRTIGAANAGPDDTPGNSRGNGPPEQSPGNGPPADVPGHGNPGRGNK